MVAALRASWFAWRLPARSRWADDLVAEARLLHRLGFHTAAAMTARAALDRLIRPAIATGSPSSGKIAERCSAGLCLRRLVEQRQIESEQGGVVRRALRRLNRVCHGQRCDRVEARELLSLALDARAALLTAKFYV